jgi:hypothetical protein
MNCDNCKDLYNCDYYLHNKLGVVDTSKYPKLCKEKHSVITLCGSTEFKDEFMKVQKKLTLEGNIVISLGVFGHHDNENLTSNTIQMLENIHRLKIDMSDEIFVINKNGYIGESTKSEIEYAKSIGKNIRYLEPINEIDPYAKHIQTILNSNENCMIRYRNGISEAQLNSIIESYEKNKDRIKDTLKEYPVVLLCPRVIVSDTSMNYILFDMDSVYIGYGSLNCLDDISNKYIKGPYACESGEIINDMNYMPFMWIIRRDALKMQNIKGKYNVNFAFKYIQKLSLHEKERVIVYILEHKSQIKDILDCITTTTYKTTCICKIDDNEFSVVMDHSNNVYIPAIDKDVIMYFKPTKDGKKEFKYTIKPLEEIFFKACVYSLYLSANDNKVHTFRDIVNKFSEMGFPIKQLWYYLEKWANIGFYNYGVTSDLGWFEFDKLTGVYKEIYDKMKFS